MKIFFNLNDGLVTSPTNLPKYYVTIDWALRVTELKVRFSEDHIGIVGDAWKNAMLECEADEWTRYPWRMISLKKFLLKKILHILFGSDRGKVKRIYDRGFIYETVPIKFEHGNIK